MRRMSGLRDLGRAPEKRYEHLTEGFNYRLDEIQGAVLRVKLRHLASWTRTRRRWAALYRKLLKGLPLMMPPADRNGSKHTYHLFVIRSKERDALGAHLKSKGIATGVFYPMPLPLQPAYRSLKHRKGQFPVTETACREVLAIPMFAELGAARVERVAREIQAFYRGRSR